MLEKVLIDFACNLNFSSEEIQEFIQNNWLRETLLTDNTFYTWQFLDPIANNHRDNVILAIYKSKIVGFFGLNRREFILHEKTLIGAELTTWIIQKEYQRKGFAKPMLEHIKDNFDIVYGANITTDALKVYLRLGFHYIKEVPRLIKIYNYEKVSTLGTIDHLIKKVYKNKVSSSNPYTHIDLNDVPEIASNNSFSRSQKNLLWRYKDHPIYTYRLLTQDTPQNTPCYIFYRIEHVNNVKIMIITDILTTNLENTNLSFINSYAQDNQIDMVEFYSTNSELNALLYMNDFIPLQDLKEFIDIPYLYNPLEVKKSKSYSLIYYAKDQYILNCLNSNTLYITKSDCDLDRPNHAYLKKIEEN